MSSLPLVRIPHPHVEVRDSLLEGSPCVRGTKVPVRRLWAWHRKGVSMETLFKRYQQLGPSVVLDAISFAYDNLELISADLGREQERLNAEAEPVPGDMKQLPMFK